MDEAVSFGVWLRRRRRALDLTQEELARRVGCARVTLQKIELEERRPSREIAARLAELLEIAPAERPAFLRAARGELLAAPLPTSTAGRGTEPVDVALPMAMTKLHAVINNLPASMTPIVGRAHEVAFAQALLRQPTPRLLTFTGAGGTGKTRLALEVAWEVISSFRDGVVFVSLAPIADATLVGPTIAQVLDVQERGGEPVAALLQRFLRAKQLLLVLDNFEQVLPAAPLLAELLAAAPALKVLVTSRAPLHLRGEQEVPVLPLLVPDVQRLPPRDGLMRYAAVELFVQRVQAVQPDFQLTESTVRAVAEICARLDGLPLAIELVATRIKVLGLHALLDRLQPRLALLADGARDLPARQQTIRGTIAWSYDLLDVAAQQLFARLGVFTGGWTLEAADAVCNGEHPSDVLGLLAVLVDHSLVQLVDGIPNETRFGMLETVREYALERLETDPALDAASLGRRHAAYYLTLAEQAAAELRGPRELGWLNRLEVEHDNLRSALRWSHAQGDDAIGLRLADALVWFWRIRGHGSEGRAWIEPLLESTRAQRTPLRATALMGAARLALDERDLARGTAYVRESVALFREHGNPRGIAMALNDLGWEPAQRGDFVQAMAIYEESVALFRELGDPRDLATALCNLGRATLHLGDYERARAYVDESRPLFEAAGDFGGLTWANTLSGRLALAQGANPQAQRYFGGALALARQGRSPAGIAFSLLYLGYAMEAQRDHAAARGYYEEALPLFHDVGIRDGITAALLGLGQLTIAQADHRAAYSYHHEAFTVIRDVQDVHGAAIVLLGLGFLALAAGDEVTAETRLMESVVAGRRPSGVFGLICALEGLGDVAVAQHAGQRAACLYGAVAALREAMGQPHLEPFEQFYIEHRVFGLDAASQLAAFPGAWADGRAMTLEQVVAYALHDEG